MARRILIRHTGGSRMHQTDEFSADGLRGISVGRSETSDVRFDPQRDDVVSREHLRITPAGTGADDYLISDLNSRNGTFLNRKRISQPTPIRHNDVVQLGLNGPEFRFELDPAPAASARPTRLDAGGTGLTPTREVGVAYGDAPRPIGRATVERMLGETFGKVKKESNKSLWIGLAALVLIAIVGVGSFLMLRRNEAEAARKAEQQRQMLLQMSELVQKPKAADPAVLAQIEKISKDLKKLAVAPPTAKPAGGASGAAAAADANSPYGQALAKAMSDYSSGNTMAAYQQAQNLIAMDNTRWEGFYVAARSMVALQQTSDAVTFFRYALQKAPADSRARIQKDLDAAQRSAGQ